MKRFISIFLSLTIIFSVVYFPCKDIIADYSLKNYAKDLSNQLAEMCKNNDEKYFNDESCTEIKNRLIIKADNDIDEYGAVDSVYGFDYAFLQYADEKSAETARNQYLNLGYKAEYDSIIKVTEGTSYSGKENWAYEETDATSTLDYYKLKVRSTVNVAVIDSGINYNHELFKGRITRTNMNFAGDSQEDEADTYGHGTAVSGVIAKCTPSNVKIASYRIYNSNGKNTHSAFLTACRYISNLSKKPDVVNLSLGTEDGGLVADEINLLTAAGIFCVEAAGNDSHEVFNLPTDRESCLIVSALDYKGNLCSFSNYGDEVDIAAPGDYVETASIASNDSYVYKQGTSLATPFATAAVALVKTENKNYTNSQIKQAILDAAIPFRKSDLMYVRYGVGMINFSNLITGTRCKDVTVNYQGGVYREDISVELACENTLVDIYYTTDGTLPTKTNGTKYTAPIVLSESTRLNAVAIARAGTPMHSKFLTVDYYIFKNGEDEYLIDRSGVVQAYLGNEINLIVPETINEKIPYRINAHCFDGYNIESIILPDSIYAIEGDAFANMDLKSISAPGVSSIGNRCFYNCDKLANIDLPELRDVSTEAFYGCNSLSGSIEFPKLERVWGRGFTGSSFKSIDLPVCTKVDDYAFDSCKAEEIILNKLNKFGNYCFNNCENLKTVYVPFVKEVEVSTFQNCTSLELLFVPNARYYYTDIPSNVTIYVDRVQRYFYDDDELGRLGKYTLIAPANSFAEEYANDYGYDFIESSGLNFDGVEGEYIIYTSNDGQQTRVPKWLPAEMWQDYLPINRNTELVTHEYLLDVVKDGTINAKDFAVINKNS